MPEKYEVQVRTVPERAVLSGMRRAHAPQLGQVLGDLLGRMRAAGPGRPGLAGCPYTVYYAEVSQDSDGPVEVVRPMADLATAQAAAARLGDVQARTEPEHEEAFVRMTMAQTRGGTAPVEILDVLQRYVAASGRGEPAAAAGHDRRLAHGRARRPGVRLRRPAAPRHPERVRARLSGPRRRRCALVASFARVARENMAMKSPAGWRSARAWLTSVRWPATARLLLGVVGLVLLILGAVKFAGAAGDTGPITLVVAGAVLLVVPFVLDRVQRGPAAAAPRLDPWITTQVSERGAPHTAAVLQRTRLGSLAEAYALVHDELAEPEYRSARVHLQDLLVERAASAARQEILDAREVRRLYANGSVVVRVLALGLMQGDRSLGRRAHHGGRPAGQPLQPRAVPGPAAGPAVLARPVPGRPAGCPAGRRAGQHGARQRPLAPGPGRPPPAAGLAAAPRLRPASGQTSRMAVIRPDWSAASRSW